MTQTRASRRKLAYEVFQLAVEDWSFGYSFRVAPDGCEQEYQPICSEYAKVTVTVPLISRTKRRIERVALDFRPESVSPTEWKPEWHRFGAVVGVRHRVLSAFVRIPPRAYQNLLLALSAKKVLGLEFVAYGVDGCRGMIAWVSTMDPNDLEAIA